MAKALGMIEFKTVSAGIWAADQMCKAADVELIEAEVVCPGKYIALISGELSAVRAAVDVASNAKGDAFIDNFVLGNPDPSIFPAIYGSSEIEGVDALGVLETYDASAIIVAADLAAKTADVKLIELRIAKGMCGKSYMLITGEVAAGEAAIERAKDEVGDRGMFLDSTVIARPDAQMCRKIV